MDVVIRLARPREAAIVHRILMEAYAPYRGKVVPPLKVFQSTPASIAMDIRTRRHAHALAFVGSTPVGTVRCTPERGSNGQRRWTLSRLAVLPEYRGEGIGTLLMKWMEQRARQSGVVELRGQVRTALPFLVRFYQCLGFHVLGYRSKPGHVRYLTIIGKRLR
ncbi:MAG TPA: GNAT family N-acetyltransferase [Limnochordales bacterium]|nr:GNAT family N-acetyltransferase [Limnochordales bacterium]